ncbi:MAG: DUF4360 domain-containing protein, partial [Bdellovibrionales bacterium]|nr:DUF4360 domain-containing protein [Oligoflexia bacterium]
MKLLKYLAIMSPVMVAFSASALAQVPTEQIRLGTPNYMGSGCALGTVSATLSPDAQELSILFSAFQVQAGGSSGNTVDRKNCSIAIPVFVPGGYSVSVIKTDYRGYNRLPLNASATFDLEYFFAQSSAGPSVHKSFVGASDGNFTLTNSVIATANVWSACGDSVNLRTNTNIAVQTNQFNEQSLMTIDSADISAGVVFQLQWRQCNQTPYPPQPTPYNPYPQPTPYNPYPQPTPYNPYPQPTPYQPYPQPTPVLYPTPMPLGPCVINSYMDTRGILVYMVKDGTGRVLGNSVMYAQALSIAQSSQAQGFCTGIVNNAPIP